MDRSILETILKLNVDHQVLFDITWWAYLLFEECQSHPANVKTNRYYELISNVFENSMTVEPDKVDLSLFANVKVIWYPKHIFIFSFAV